MPEFRRLRELSFPRTRGGKPEQLRVQLAQVDDGPRFVTLTHFWRSGSGEFVPPSRDTLRIQIRRSEAHAVIELLTALLDATDAAPARPASERPPKPSQPEPHGVKRAPDREVFDESRCARMTARHESVCAGCGAAIAIGDVIFYDPRARRAIHDRCLRDRSALADAVRKLNNERPARDAGLDTENAT